MITYKCACPVWLVLLQLGVLAHSENLLSMTQFLPQKTDWLKTTGTAGFENFPTKKLH